MGTFTKTINTANFNLGNGLISSTNVFQPTNYNTVHNSSSGFSGGIYAKARNVAPGSIIPNTIIDFGNVVGSTLYYLQTDFVSNMAIVVGPNPSSSYLFDLELINNNFLYSLGPIVTFSNQSITLTNLSSYFVEKVINLPVPTSVKSKLKMYLEFNTGSSSSVEYALGTFYKEDLNWIKTSESVYEKITKDPSKIGFRILANNVVVFDLKNNFSGNIEVEIPSNTSSVKFETYDEAYPVSAPTYYHKNVNYSISYNNLRINVENLSSRKIGNHTNFGNGYTYIDPIRSSSLSVSSVDNNGYYDIIVGQSELDRPVDYYVVGDDWKDPNFRPLNTNRNICLEFPNIDFTDVDEDEKIELVLDVIDINTEEAEEQYDHLGISKSITREFYKFGDDAVNSPPNTRRARMVCSVSRSDFVNTVQSISSGPSNNTLAEQVPVKGGIVIYDITQAVKDSILASREKVVIWLTYDEGTRDKYVTFKVGNTETNKPRIRYKPKR